MLAIAVDDVGGTGACHQAGGRLEHRVEFLADHQNGFVIRRTVAGREPCQSKTDDLTAFERQHRARHPRKIIGLFGKHFKQRSTHVQWAALYA